LIFALLAFFLAFFELFVTVEAVVLLIFSEVLLITVFNLGMGFLTLVSLFIIT